MNSTIQHLLAAVLLDQTEAKEPQQAALPKAEQEAFGHRVAQLFEYALPLSYLDILGQTDGLDCNGVVLYASRLYTKNERFSLQGFVEANILLRGYQPNRYFLYFAESGMDFYRHNLQTGKFEISARIGGTVFDSFETAEELFTQVLNHILGKYGEEEDDDK
ncbi:YrhA family protein [Hymenobacter terrenus]|uniref:YrhA family protein n=1 Tax=Hymenobacter terrenus TaxID=1629124 RepID=UPI0012E09027|nr:YrhA family protein [Hymenobacter terrenus]